MSRMSFPITQVNVGSDPSVLDKTKKFTSETSSDPKFTAPGKDAGLEGMNDLEKLFAHKPSVAAFKIGTSLFKSGSEIFSAMNQVRASRLNRKFRGQQLRFNAELARESERQVLKRGKKQAKQISQQAETLVGKQVVALAAQGQDLGGEDAVDLFNETRDLAAEDARTVELNAIREAFGFKLESIQLESQARFERISGKTRERATLLAAQGKAATDTLSAVGSIGKLFATG